MPAYAGQTIMKIRGGERTGGGEHGRGTREKVQVAVLLPRFLLLLYLYVLLNSSVTSRKRFYDRVRATIATAAPRRVLQSQTTPSFDSIVEFIDGKQHSAASPSLPLPSFPPPHRRSSTSSPPFFRPGNRYFIGVQIDCKVVKVTIDFPRFSVFLRAANNNRPTRYYLPVHCITIQRSPPLICYDAGVAGSARVSMTGHHRLIHPPPLPFLFLRTNHGFTALFTATRKFNPLLRVRESHRDRSTAP